MEQVDIPTAKQIAERESAREKQLRKELLQHRENNKKPWYLK